MRPDYYAGHARVISHDELCFLMLLVVALFLSLSVESNLHGGISRFFASPLRPTPKLKLSDTTFNRHHLSTSRIFNSSVRIFDRNRSCNVDRGVKDKFTESAMRGPSLWGEGDIYIFFSIPFIGIDEYSYLILINI